MKSITANLPRGTFATAVAGILLFASRFPAFAQPASENEHHSVRPEFYYMGGEIKVPNRYLYTNGLTLTAAVKRAKGMTALAAPTKVSIIRIGEKPLLVDCKAIEQGKAKDIELRPGDKVWLPRK